MKNLDFDQMEKVNGGVPLEEYCATVKAILMNADNDVPADAASYAAYLCKEVW